MGGVEVMTDELDLKGAALVSIWRDLYRKEREAREQRLQVEQEISDLQGVAEDHEGAVKFGELTVAYSLRKRIDPDRLQEAAKNHGIPTDRLGELFRWKPEINAQAWKQASKAERNALSSAITSIPAKPAFKDRNKETK